MIKKIYTQNTYNKVSAEEINQMIAENTPLVIEKEVRKAISTTIKTEHAYAVLVTIDVKKAGKVAKKDFPFYGFKSYDRAVQFANEMDFGETKIKNVRFEGKTPVNENCDKMLQSPKFMTEAYLNNK